jgi:hypothetical protein
MKSEDSEREPTGDLLRLTSLLESMSVPASRRDVAQTRNLEWIGRNLGIQNLGNPQFAEAIEITKRLISKSQSPEC